MKDQPHSRYRSAHHKARWMRAECHLSQLVARKLPRRRATTWERSSDLQGRPRLMPGGHLHSPLPATPDCPRVVRQFAQLIKPPTEALSANHVETHASPLRCAKSELTRAWNCSAELPCLAALHVRTTSARSVAQAEFLKCLRKPQ
jgi:hypothetical protein